MVRPNWLAGVAVAAGVVTGAACGDEDDVPGGAPTVSLRCSAQGFWYWNQDEGTWYATRLTPPRTPYLVERVRYQMVADEDSGAGEGIGCDSSLDDSVALMARPGDLPQEAIETAADFLVEAPSGGDPMQTVERVVAVDPPLRVEDGESVWVLVSTANDGTNLGCVSACGVPPDEASRSFMSDGLEPPFDWSTLREISGDRDGFTFEVEGRVAGD